MSSRRLQDMSSRLLQHMSARRLQDMFSGCLQDVFSATIFCLPRLIQDVLLDVFRTSSRCLGRRKIVVLKTSWRRLQDTLKTSSRRANVCWVRKRYNWCDGSDHQLMHITKTFWRSKVRTLKQITFSSIRNFLTWIKLMKKFFKNWRSLIS